MMEGKGEMTRNFLLFLVLFMLPTMCDCNMIATAWAKAVKQTLFEQEVEDVNSVHKFDNHLERRLIVMPLSEAFNPNQAHPMFGKLQYGDKCSLPSSIGRLIFEKPYEVPWIFEVKKVAGSGASNEQQNNSVSAISSSDRDNDDIFNLTKVLDKAYISPLDFRSPENYIFMPKWLMKSMRLKSYDLVDVSFVRIKLAGLVVMQPLSLDWDLLVAKNKNPQTVLEHEVNKYSSLTKGSTILIQVDGIEYPFHVKDTKAEGGVSVKGVRVQDSDVKVDFDRSYLDSLIKAKKEQEAKEKPKATESTAKASPTKPSPSTPKIQPSISKATDSSGIKVTQSSHSISITTSGASIRKTVQSTTIGSKTDKTDSKISTSNLKTAIKADAIIQKASENSKKTTSIPPKTTAREITAKPAASSPSVTTKASDKKVEAIKGNSMASKIIEKASAKKDQSNDSNTKKTTTKSSGNAKKGK